MRRLIKIENVEKKGDYVYFRMVIRVSPLLGSHRLEFVDAYRKKQHISYSLKEAETGRSLYMKYSVNFADAVEAQLEKQL